ncbi:MAG: hypothetical protein HQK76_20965 [Desulfobacterales bacterium]|nr:hypothetical protein [Desulfobacterales bacterium]
MLQRFYKSKSFICILILLSLSNIGCFLGFNKQHISYFEDKAKTYEQVMRWGDLRSAYKSMKADSQNQLQNQNAELLNNIKIISYEVIKLHQEKDNLLVEQSVEIKYYHIDQLVEKIVIDHQRWEYDEENKEYYLTTGLPKFE